MSNNFQCFYEKTALVDLHSSNFFCVFYERSVKLILILVLRLIFVYNGKILCTGIARITRVKLVRSNES